ncbi:MAG: hypothetical protein PUG50_02360 [Eubacteriales bacterium]|jgi:hypothetical protein|uniref:hypothetical protein n=1 Tax=Fenollaria TaxID=1686313 RepID=UPI00071D847F|nr:MULTISPECIES: hypothetical protein [Fenollaria]MDD7339409.1 hypothetical protein [Eubacteriales bacterium]MDY3106026.1 hypothetical protein [Fenollaria sp.]
MNLLVVILNEMDKLDELLLELSKKSITGGTILDSQGMASTLAGWHKDISAFGGLRQILNGQRPFNKTLLMVLDDEKLVVAKEVVKTVMGNINNENTGIMFTLDVKSVEGLTK